MNSPIKLNKGDIGVYITFALFGAGVGLLVGSIISSRMQHTEDDFIDEEETHKELQDAVKETRTTGETTASKEVLPVRGSGSDRSGRAGTEEKSRDDGPGSNDEIEEEYEDLRKEYIVPNDEEDEYDFSSLHGYQKPDLDDLVDLEEPAGRFSIQTTDPRKDPDPEFKKVIKLMYDPDKDILVRLVGNRHSPISDMDATIGEDTIDTVMELITLRDTAPVYVCDHELNKAYSIDILVKKE